MSRRDARTAAFAIVRRDRLEGHEYDPDAVSPPAIAGGEYSYTVVQVVLTEDVALREVERLNRIADDAESRYFWQSTHLFLDGGSRSEGP